MCNMHQYYCVRTLLPEYFNYLLQGYACIPVRPGNLPFMVLARSRGEETTYTLLQTIPVNLEFQREIVWFSNYILVELFLGTSTSCDVQIETQKNLLRY